MKVAIYVEGITEAGFVYQLIGEKYQWDWSKVQIECINLDPKEAANDIRDIGIEGAPDYFLIYDSGSDTSVVSDIREKFQGHRNQGFDKVVGLRDVYSDNYIALYGRKLDSQNISEFIEDIQNPFKELDKTDFIRVRFAIMETEAWLLALSDVFQRIDNHLDANYLLNNAGVDVNNDPQTTYFHPYAKLEDVFSSIGKSYSKHWREIKDIVFKLTWTDFEQLYRSGRCISFKSFYDAIFN